LKYSTEIAKKIIIVLAIYEWVIYANLTFLVKEFAEYIENHTLSGK